MENCHHRVGMRGLDGGALPARANLSPLVLTGGQPGGLLTTTSIVENFPGFPEGVDGYELMTRMPENKPNGSARVQAFGKVEAVDFSQASLLAHGGGEKVGAQAVIHRHRREPPTSSGVPGEDLLETKGVTYCATCDGALPVFRNQPLVWLAAAIPRAKKRCI